MLYDKLDDTSRGFLGFGGQLNIWDDTLSKYVLFIPLETLPSVVGSTNSVEHDVTTSETIGKIKGKNTIEDKDVTFLWHRDNLIRLNQFLGKQNDFLVSYPDGTGWEFTAEYTYKPDDSASSDKTTGTISFITSKTDSEATLNVRDLMARTCIIESTIDSEINLKTSGTKEYKLQANVSGATFNASSDNTGIIVDSQSLAQGTLKITAGTTATSGIVTLNATKTGMASWKTTILVNVEA